MSNYLLKNFALQAYLGYKAGFQWGNLPTWISRMLVHPFLFVLLFSVTGRFAGNPGGAETFIIGMAAFAIPTAALDGVLVTWGTERRVGTVPMLFSIAGSRLVMYLARGVVHVANAILSLWSALGFGALFLGLNFGSVNWPTFWVAVMSITFASTALALFLGPFILVIRDNIGFSAVFQGALIVLSGAIIPTSVLPNALQAAGHALPMTAGLVAFRAAFAGADIASVLPSLMQESMVGVVYGSLGYVVYRAFESMARKSGQIAFENG